MFAASRVAAQVSVGPAAKHRQRVKCGRVRPSVADLAILEITGKFGGGRRSLPARLSLRQAGGSSFSIKIGTVYTW